MNANRLVNEIDSALGLLDKRTRDLLAQKPGAAYEAFVLTLVGNDLSNRLGWGWVHPLGLATFSVASGGRLGTRLLDLSHVSAPSGQCLIQAVSAIGRSGALHQLDIVLAEVDEPDLTWSAVRAVVECKNTVSVQTLSTARDLVGLAAEMRLGSHYRLWRSRPFGSALLVAAQRVSSAARELAEHWQLLAQDDAEPGTALLAGSWVQVIADEIASRTW